MANTNKRKPLTDKKKAMIIADAALTPNKSDVARKHGVSESMVRKVLKGNPEYAKLCEEKKIECQQSMVDYLASISGMAKDIIWRSMEALADPERMKTASYRDIATVTGILIDKFTGIDRVQLSTPTVPININFSDNGEKNDKH